jgi:uncharacterized integral membrane protein
VRTFKLSLAIAILVVLFIFSAFNSQPVQIRFIGFQSGDLPLFLFILFSFLLGFLVAALLSTIRVSQLRRQLHVLQKEAASRKPESGESKPA